jgi:hypothetical protein
MNRKKVLLVFFLFIAFFFIPAISEARTSTEPNVDLTINGSQSSATIPLGQTATLNGSISGSGTKCESMSGNIPGFGPDYTGFTPSPFSGHETTTVTPSSPGTYWYIINCVSNGWGGLNSGDPEYMLLSHSVELIVTSVTPTATLTANPSSGLTGMSSNLTWSSQNATSCTSADFNTGGTTQGGPLSTGALNTAKTYTYTITCTGAGGSANATATVVVNPQPPPQASLTANTPNITTGQSSTLNWSCTNSTTASISPTLGTVTPTSGGTTTPVSPASTTTYTLTCTGPGGAATANATVTVTNPLPDLTAGSAPNITTTLGSPIPLSGTIKNIGGASTGTGFNNVFLTNLNSSQTDWNTKQVVPINNALAAGASQTISTTFPGSTFPSIGNYSWEYCANLDANWVSTINESNPNNNCSARGIITITAPDLTAADVSPSVASTNVATALSGQVSNIGNASTGTGFTDLFEINPNAIPSSFSSIRTLRTYASAAVAKGSHNTASASYTFPSAGTWYVRLCADMNASGVGSIIESNENNNCSPDWIAVTVTAPLSGSCTVSPSSGKVGDPFTWTVSNVTGGTGSYSYSWNGTDGLSGTNTSVTKTYTTSGTKNGSVTVTSGSNSKTFNCTTTTGTGTGSCSNGSCIVVYPPPTVSCSANPTTIDIGQSTTLTWSSTNANSCQFVDESTSRGTSGTRIVTPTQSPTTTYGLNCTGSGGTTNTPCYMSINVIVPSCSISANPDRVKSGDTATLTWSTANVTSCKIQNASGTVLSTSCNGGPLTTAPITSQQTYTITCSTIGATISDSAIINILTVFQQF